MVEMVKRQMPEEMELECLCGRVISGKTEEVLKEYEKCKRNHYPDPKQWAEAYSRIQQAKEQRSKEVKKEWSA